MRVAVYARFSSDLQRDTSLDDQIAVARRYAEGQGWDVLAEHVYADAAVSGSSLEGRAGLSALLANAQRRPRPFDVLLVDDSSRVARDLADALRVMQQLRFAGVRVIYISQQIDSASEQAETLVTVHGLVDALYLREMAAKIRRGLAGQAERGFATGAKTLGYRTVPVPDPSGRLDPNGSPILLGKAIEVEPVEAATVRDVFEWYAAGLGVNRIVERLGAEGRPLKYGAVRHLLANERYTGRWIWNQRRFERRPGSRSKVVRELPRSEWRIKDRPDLRIVSDELWSAVQARRAAVRAATPTTGRMRGKNAALHSRHLFSGFMRCGECGGAFIVVTGGYGSPRYGCLRAWRNGRSACGNRLTVRAKVADPLLLQGLQSALLEPRTITALTESLGRQLNAVLDQRPTIRAAKAAERDAVAKRVSNLLRAIEDGASSGAVLSGLAAREQELAQLNAEIAALDEEPLRDRLAVMPTWVREQVAEVAELMRDSPERTKRAFQRLDVGFTVSPIRTEAARAFLRASGNTDFSAILAGSGADFSTVVSSDPRSEW